MVRGKMNHKEHKEHKGLATLVPPASATSFTRNASRKIRSVSDGKRVGVGSPRAVINVAWVAAGALVLVTGARAQEPKPAAGRTVWDGVYSEQQAERGRSAYMDACASCHAKDLRGDSTAPSLVEESFSFQWSDATVAELFDRIRTLMPSDRPNSLSSQRYRDIVAFVLQANTFPAGDKDLDEDVAALRQILITMKRPQPSGRP
jgi:mono/diheme cytochrome c family protein